MQYILLCIYLFLALIFQVGYKESMGNSALKSKLATKKDLKVYIDNLLIKLPTTIYVRYM